MASKLTGQSIERVDGDETRVGHRAAHERGVQQAHPIDAAYEPPLPGDQPSIFDALDRLAGQLGGHGVSWRSWFVNRHHGW